MSHPPAQPIATAPSERLASNLRSLAVDVVRPVTDLVR